MNLLDLIAKTILFVALTGIMAGMVYMANHVPALFFTITGISTAVLATLWALERIVMVDKEKE